MSDMQPPPPKPAPPTTTRIYVVDRIENGVAVLIPDDEAFACEDMPVRKLGRRVSEGDVVRVPVRADGSPAWKDVWVDSDQRVERIEQAEARLERLRKRDPGGDVVL